ncbi:hypothetical protein WT22_01130 [Burkholderia territorii]|nr:hypothetical protein WT22_01130 [Burkholderia territorii]KWA42295.1 hypothetical protein WT40_02210 [Burkholderia territorii]
MVAHAQVVGMSDYLAETASLKPETGWFHVFRSLVESGALASMDGSTIKVYLVIKTHTNVESGIAGPLGQDVIAKKSGVHPSSVKRAIAQLEGLGYLSKTRRGKACEYRFQEKWRLHDEDGTHTGMASWTYVPTLVKTISDALRAGKVPPSVQIEKVQLNINQVGAGGVVINMQDSVDMQQALQKMSPEMRRKMEAILGRVGIVTADSFPQCGTSPQLTGDLGHG